MSDGLNNKQFVTIALIIIICGIAIVGHNYFMEKRANAYEKMSILLSQEPEYVEAVTPTESNKEIPTGDTSGRVKKKKATYNYIGRLKIPKINLNRGFVKYGTSGNNVDQNIAIMEESTYPDDKYSNFILAGHSGTGWNGYFTRLDNLSLGDLAYVTYKGKRYTYQLVKKYKDRQGDGVDVYRHSQKKQLTLITCARPDYRTYYLVLIFELTEEKSL